jgi:electron transfer flavoprotein alpha subunit
MAGTLVIAELGDGKVKKATHSAITFAKQAGTPFAILVLGAGAANAAKELTGFGAQKVLVTDDASLAHYIAERFAPTVAKVAKDGGWDTVVMTATSTGKDLAPRVAAKLSAGYAPDVDRVKVDGGKRSYRRPQYSGNALGWLEITTPVHVVSVRQTEFTAAEPSGGASLVENVAKAADDAAAARVEFVKIESGKSERPDLGEARVVVSGGRSLKEQFKQVLEPLADGHRREPRGVRRGVRPAGAPGRADGAHGRAAALRGGGHLGGHPAHRRDEGLEVHRGDQQGRRRADLPDRGLRARGGSLRGRARDGEGAEGAGLRGRDDGDE